MTAYHPTTMQVTMTRGTRLFSELDAAMAEVFRLPEEVSKSMASFLQGFPASAEPHAKSMGRG